MTVLLIDNYDSFTYNLYHYLMEIGATVNVQRNDALRISDIRTMNPSAIILSPGPCTPNEAGICLDIIKELHSSFAILGVCLGHQSIGQSFGGQVVRGEKPMHAQVTPIHQYGHALFKRIPSTFKATRYHSLIVDKNSLPDCLEAIAHSDDGVIQAIAHKQYPVYGVQFHPESIASEYGHVLLQNFLNLASLNLTSTQT
jgi:anthranilate synthase component 2